MHLRTCGSETLPALLLLHQAPSHSGMYERLMSALCEQFYCIAPDFPGCGNSDPAQVTSIENIADVVASTLLAMDISPTVLFGHHTGASVAAQLAAFHDLGQYLVLSGPPLLSHEQKAKLAQSAPNVEVDDKGLYLSDMWQFIRSKDLGVNVELSQRELLSSVQLGGRVPTAL